MANPNIVNVATLSGKTSVYTLTTATQSVVTNSAASGKILKVDSLFVSNTTSTAATVTIDLYRSSTAYKITSTVSVPANATLLVVDKASNIFLEEGDTLRAIAGSANALQLVASYEELS
jgi:hypothetical protein